MHCCGGRGYNGYEEWNGRFDSIGKSVPDSCCRDKKKNCGKIEHGESVEDIRRRIFTDGCLNILKTKLENKVIPIMLVYAGIAVILAIIEIVSTVLAAAYVAQIKRRSSRFNATFGNWNFSGENATPSIINVPSINVNAQPYETEMSEEMSFIRSERSSIRDTEV